MHRPWLFLSLFLAHAASAAPYQDQTQFEAALRNTSTSPSYVLITIMDDRTGQSRIGCVEANFLQGALHRELNLPNDKASIQRVQKIALDNQKHIFHFSNPDALANIPFRYSQDELEQARAIVRAHSAEIASHTLDRRLLPGKMQWSDAFACALVEQGYRATNADIGGLIGWGR